MRQLIRLSAANPRPKQGFYNRLPVASLSHWQFGYKRWFWAVGFSLQSGLKLINVVPTQSHAHLNLKNKKQHRPNHEVQLR